MKTSFAARFASWVPLAVGILLVYGILFYVMQQYIRLSANEIPLQVATHAISKLESGATLAESLPTAEQVNIKSDISPFVMVCDSVGQIQASNAVLNGKTPEIPIGVFKKAESSGENKISWQPLVGFRYAIVVLPFHKNGTLGFVIGGQSMKEVESRIQFVFYQIVAGIIITLIATFFASMLVQARKNQKQ